MPNSRITFFGLVAALLVGLPTLATTEQRVETFIIDDGKHPTAHQEAFVVANDIEDDVHLCFGYANSFNKANTGSLRGRASLTRFDPDTGEGVVEKFGKRGRLDKNKWLRCVQTGPVRQGDMVVMDYEFSGFPRPRGGTIHIRSGLGKDRLLISELRGPIPNAEPAEENEIHHRNRAIVAENGKHRKSWQQGWVISQDSVDMVQFCFGYGNNFNKGSQGSVDGIAEITRLDPDTGETSTERIRKKGNVKNNKFVKCAETDPVRLGDSVVVDYALTGFPRLRGNAKVAGAAAAAGGDAFEIATGIGAAELGKAELLGPAPAGGGGDGGGGDNPDPPTSGALSAADQAAVRKLLNRALPTAQLWRPKGRILGKWTAIGPKFQLGNVLNVNPATVGQGNTIAEAVADYEKKRGPLPSVSGGLTAAEQECIAWLGTINPSQGSTAIRWGPGGSGWHGEFFRPSTGPIGQRASSMLAACQWIRANLPS